MLLENIVRKIAALLPGTALNIAQRKRRYERQLRAQGYSRREALRLSTEHFRKGE